jgi:histidine triad (HIT) family protein
LTLQVPQTASCPFCEYLQGVTDCAFVSRSSRVAAFVNLRQYEQGAMLIVPVLHAPTLLDVDGELLAECWQESRRIGRALIRAFGATGLNVFTNAGVDAGQTVPHFHIHVVPRYPGGDPRRLFQEKNHEPVAIEVRRDIGARVRAALADLDTAAPP